MKQLWLLLCLLCIYLYGEVAGGGDGATGPSTPSTAISIPRISSGTDPSTSIHLALIFDYHVAHPAAENGFEFVWGGEAKMAHAGVYRTLYEPLDRSGSQTLAWFQQMHPTWIVYECDGVTPAWHNDGTGTQYVPIDISNPDVIQFQLADMSSYLADPANGYSAVGFDNVNLNNSMSDSGLAEKRCGTRDANGVFHARWAQLSAYQADVIAWASAMRAALQQQFQGKGVAINFEYDPQSPTQSAQLLQAVDTEVDEAGFTYSGTGYLADAAWSSHIQMLDGLLKQGKRVAIINQVPGATITPEATQWILASYLMIADPSAYVFISRQQEYGYVPDWLRTIVQSNPTGAATGPFTLDQGVYSRTFANSIALVNPSSTATISANLSGGYRDLYGNHYSGTVTLPPHSGLLLFPE